MNINQISELVIKVTAILCFLYALSHLGYYSSYFFIPDMPPTDIIISNAIGPIVGPVIAGIFLLINAQKWGQRLVTSSCDTEKKSEIPITEWHSMFLSLMGIFIVVTTIAPLVNELFVIFRAQSHLGYEVLSSSTTARLIGYLLTIFIGLALSLGSRGIVGTIRRLKHAGL